jgi:endonuclease
MNSRPNPASSSRDATHSTGSTSTIRRSRTAPQARICCGSQRTRRAVTIYSPRPDEAQLFQLDGGRFRRYDPATDPPPDSDPADRADDLEEDEAETEPREFAYESDLRDFLARNLAIIEPGLQLYEEEGITGVEFPVGGRFADIIGVDGQERLVVIELKVSRGYDRVIGQLLRYMAWIDKHQAEEGQGVRGMIIAREISEDLRLACSSIPNVELYEYELAVTLRSVAV